MEEFYLDPIAEKSSQECLLIGFDDTVNPKTFHLPELPNCKRIAEQSPADALEYFVLQNRRFDQYTLPWAFICDYQWLEKHGFAFAELAAAHPEFRLIPLIAISGEPVSVDKALLAQKGVDDLYIVPFDAQALKNRIDFLNEFKPECLFGQTLDRGEKDFHFKTPRAKRIFDILGAGIGLLLSLPVWLTALIAIKLSSKGPILYRSKRVGTGYHVFDFLKFRSMYQDADKRLHELRHMNQYSGENQVFLKFADDPRITPVGRFIRRYSIDELPQLINVLRGDMSLVGNRPLPLYEAEMLTLDEWSARFNAPAGITGLWQVTKRGRSDMSAEERIQLDIDYSRNYSVWADLSIIAKTFGAFIQKENV